MSEEETTAAAEAAEPEAAEPKKPKKPGRSFQLKPDGPNRLCFGSSPRVSIGADEPYTTEDARLARRLAAHPLLEETT